MNQIIETTKEHFGEYAQSLLNAHAIIPLTNPKFPKAGIAGWMNGYDPAKEVNFHSLGVLVGPKSGITVWDIDSHHIEPPVAPNVTTAKGCHIYTAHAQEERIIRVADSIDLLGDSGFAIFHGPGRKFIHPEMASSEVLHQWISTLTNQSLFFSLQGKKEGYKKGYEEGINEGYYNQMLSEGYDLDRVAIERGYVALMRTRPEGTRNNSLYLYARELIRCGIKTDALEDAAIDSGLTSYEIRATVSSAEAEINMHASTSIFDQVTMWRDTTWHMVPEYGRPVIDFIAERAIVLNDHSPFIVQQEIVDALARSGIARSQQAVSKTLVSLDRHYGVLKIVFLGFMPDGRRKPNAYRLCIDGIPVSEVSHD